MVESWNPFAPELTQCIAKKGAIAMASVAKLLQHASGISLAIYRS